ncbi:class I SAM-dependent methyltransferase [Alloscardovia omnicolens]|uniref:class I SAM-dependent methyltransferase n=1 Tax=Alloscardovia omnicolens TaxID=419015 RepID=UPI003A69955E
MNSTHEQYFSAQPSTEDDRKKITISMRGTEYDVTVSRSVFSTHRLDLGTKVLLDRVPSPADLPEQAHILDLGCGWGPISIAAAAEAPHTSTIWALDVNERAIELAALNASHAGLSNVRAGTVESFERDFGADWSDAHFDLIWSNPPIRIGKEELHTLLMTYLPRLTVGGHAYMVVQKHLGADSLMSWLDSQLNNDATASYEVSKFASAKGYRIIEVERLR